MVLRSLGRQRSIYSTSLQKLTEDRVYGPAMACCCFLPAHRAGHHSRLRWKGKQGFSHCLPNKGCCESLGGADTSYPWSVYSSPGWWVPSEWTWPRGQGFCSSPELLSWELKIIWKVLPNQRSFRGRNLMPTLEWKVWVVVSHHVGASTWIQVLCKSNSCPWWHITPALGEEGGCQIFFFAWVYIVFLSEFIEWSILCLLNSLETLSKINWF